MNPKQKTALRNKVTGFDSAHEVAKFPGLIDVRDASMDGMAIADQN